MAYATGEHEDPGLPIALKSIRPDRLGLRLARMEEHEHTVNTFLAQRGGHPNIAAYYGRVEARHHTEGTVNGLGFEAQECSLGAELR